MCGCLTDRYKEDMERHSHKCPRPVPVPFPPTFVRTLRPNGVLGTLPTIAATYLDICAETPTLTALPPGK